MYELSSKIESLLQKYNQEWIVNQSTEINIIAWVIYYKLFLTSFYEIDLSSYEVFKIKYLKKLFLQEEECKIVQTGILNESYERNTKLDSLLIEVSRVVAIYFNQIIRLNKSKEFIFNTIPKNIYYRLTEVTGLYNILTREPLDDRRCLSTSTVLKKTPIIDEPSSMTESDCTKHLIPSFISMIQSISPFDLSSFELTLISKYILKYEKTTDIHYLGLLLRAKSIFKNNQGSLPFVGFTNEYSIEEILNIPKNAGQSNQRTHTEIIWKFLRMSLEELNYNPPRYLPDNKEELTNWLQIWKKNKDKNKKIEIISNFSKDEVSAFNFSYNAIQSGLVLFMIVDWDKYDKDHFLKWKDPRHILMITSISSSGECQVLDTSYPTTTGSNTVSFHHIYESLYQKQIAFFGWTNKNKNDLLTKKQLVLETTIDHKINPAIHQKIEKQFSLAYRALNKNDSIKFYFLNAIHNNLTLIYDSILRFMPSYIHMDALGTFPGNFIMAFQLAWLKINYQIDFNDKNAPTIEKHLSKLDNLIKNENDCLTNLINPVIKSKEGRRIVGENLFKRPSYSMFDRYQAISKALNLLPSRPKFIFDMGGGTGLQWLEYKPKNDKVVIIDQQQHPVAYSLISLYPGDNKKQKKDILQASMQKKKKGLFLQLRQNMSLPAIGTNKKERALISDYLSRIKVAVFSFSLHQNRESAEEILKNIVQLVKDNGWVITLGEPRDFDNFEKLGKWPIRIYKVQQNKLILFNDNLALKADQHTLL